jgi:hypothetical protein
MRLFRGRIVQWREWRGASGGRELDSQQRRDGEDGRKSVNGIHVHGWKKQ